MIKNRLRFASICYYVAAACWFTVVVIGLFSHHEIRIVYLAMGVCFLCLAFMMGNKAKKQETDDSKKEE